MSGIKDKDDIAFVLCPGSFSPKGHYKNVCRQLITNGFENVEELQLPSVCPPSAQLKPPAKLEDDAKYVREVIQAFLSNGKDVILVMNAYAGFPGTEAVKDLQSGRGFSPPGTTGGAVVGMVYLSSFLPHVGDSLRSMYGDMLFEPLKSGSPGGYIVMPDGADQGIFNDWYAEGRGADAKAAATDLLTQSSDSFDGEVTNDMWSKPENFKGKLIYIMGDMDLIVPPSFGQSMIDKVNGIVPERVKTIHIKDGGHVTHITKPEIVVGVLEDLVADLQTQKEA